MHGIRLVVGFVVLCVSYPVVVFVVLCGWYHGVVDSCLPIRGNEWFLMHGNAISMVFDEHHAISIVHSIDMLVVKL